MKFKDKYRDIVFKMLYDKNINKEIKLFLIIELIHNETIGLYKAYELCEEVGLFSEPWFCIDYKTTKIYEKLQEG